MDGTKFVGRVLFDDVSDLGIEWDGARIGQAISFDGYEGEVTVYNAAEVGSIAFTISFSGAVQMISSTNSFLALSAAAALIGFTHF